jgi:hypothetical protein
MAPGDMVPDMWPPLPIDPGDMVPGDMVPDMWPPLPTDPPRAMAGPATDQVARQAIAAAKRGMDLFMVKSFLGSPGSTYRFPYYQGAMDRFAEVLAPDCRPLARSCRHVWCQRGKPMARAECDQMEPLAVPSDRIPL